MLEYIITFILIAIAIIYFLTKVLKQDSQPKQPSKKTSSRPSHDIQSKTQESPKETNSTEIDSSKIITDTKPYLIKSIKEVKNLKRCYVYHNGHILLFSDEKRITLCYMKSLIGDKGTKCISKSVDMDLISDISYSEDTKIIACTLKNSKETVFYHIEYDSSKNRLGKLELHIPSNRQFEIRNVVISKNGQYVSTSGTDKDTEVHIFSATKGGLISRIDTGGIHNLEMKMTPDDNYLGVSTFLNEISVIHFEKNEKFNKDALAYETMMKVSRKKSVSGIKEPISCFEFSNDERFFVLGCNNQIVKVFQNFGNFSDSKVFSEFKIDSKTNVIALFIDDFFNGKIKGFVTIAFNNDIYIHDTDGNVQMVLKEAHEDEVIMMKMVKVNFASEINDNSSIGEEDMNKINFNDDRDKEKDSKIILISASRDGRIKMWDLNKK